VAKYANTIDIVLINDKLVVETVLANIDVLYDLLDFRLWYDSTWCLVFVKMNRKHAPAALGSQIT
jgi:hypothetical protein